MVYTIQQLAALAGISTRTLRYYDSTGLLSAQRNQTMTIGNIPKHKSTGCNASCFSAFSVCH